MNLSKIFNKGNVSNVKSDISLPEFIHRDNVIGKLPEGQYKMQGSSNVTIPELTKWDDALGKYVSLDLTPHQAVILNDFLIHSGYSGFDTAEALNRLNLTDVVSNAIKEGSDFTPYLRDALKKDPVALAAFEDSLKQAANYDNIITTMNTNKAELAKAKAREAQAAALNEIKKQTEQANRNAQFMEKYGKPYNRINASKEYIKDVLWRGDKSIYNSIKNIKNMNQPTKLITLNTLNAATPIVWNTPILEKIFGDRSPKEWGQAGQVATTGYLANRYLGGVSNKAAILAAALQGLGSLGASSYFRQNQDKPNNTDNQEASIEWDKSW